MSLCLLRRTPAVARLSTRAFPPDPHPQGSLATARGQLEGPTGPADGFALNVTARRTHWACPAPAR